MHLVTTVFMVVATVCVAVCASAAAPGEPQPPGPMAAGVLDAGEAGFVAGSLVPSPRSGEGGEQTILWQSPLFATPFEFRLDAIAGLRFTAGPVRGRPGPFVFLLRGGDGIPGDLAALDATHAVAVVAAPAGPCRVRIDRTCLERIVRGGDEALGGGFHGPVGLAGWEQSPANSWREEAGAIVTGRRGATVSRDVAAPARGRFDLVIGMRRLAGFRIGIGSGPPGSEPFRLELLRPAAGSASLVLVREQRRTADVREVMTLEPGTEFLRVALFVDQTAGRMVVVARAGEAPPATGEIMLAPEAGAAASGTIRVTVSSGEVRLDSLRVTPWSSPLAELDPPGDSFVAVTGGRPRESVIESLDAATGELVGHDDSGPVRVRLADVTEIGFGSAAAMPRPAAAATRLIRLTGESLGGRVVGVHDEAMWVAREGIDEPVPVPLESLACLRTLRTEPAGEPPGRVGRFVAEGCGIRGCLAAADDGGRLGWRPLGSLTAAAFRQSDDGGGAEAVRGAVQYVELPDAGETDSADVRVGGIGGAVNPDGSGAFVVTMMSEDGAAARDGRLQPGDRIVAINPERDATFVATRGLELNAVMNLLRGRIGTPVRLKVTDAAGRNPREIDLDRGPIGIASGQVLRQALEAHAQLAPARAAADSLHPARLVLVDGDTVACRVVAIDSAGARIATAVAVSGQRELVVPQEEIRAVELAPDAPSRTLDRQRFERLLTLPRAQRSDPPTHLLRLADGDYLRGKLLELDDMVARVDLLGTRRELPRSDVVRIIWLHPEPRASTPVARPAVLAVQGIAADGGRITLDAERFEDGHIVGTNPALGGCRIDVSRLARLVIGPHLGLKPGNLPYGRWQLRPAAEPRAVRAGAAD